MAVQRRALGRGLSALIPEAPPAPTLAGNSDYFQCPIEKIIPRIGQPRTHFEESRLSELADSLKAQGVLQPLVVRPQANGTFELIAGERRWRAAQKAGLHEVPVVVRAVGDKHVLEMALVENLQREDLNALEEAEAYARLIEQHSYTQEGLAKRLGRDRSTIANSLRLLKLPDVALEALVSGRISSGHARALLSLGSPRQVAAALEKIITGGLSVRQTEDWVKRLRTGRSEQSEAARQPAPSANQLDLQDRLSRVLGTRVRLKIGQKNRGKIEINYGSLDELERILEVLLK